MADDPTPSPPAERSPHDDHVIPQDLAERIREELSRSPPSTYEYCFPLAEAELRQRRALLAHYDSYVRAQKPARMSRVLARRYRIELGRTPPSTKNTGHPLTEGEVSRRKEALAVYFATAKRPWQVKHAETGPKLRVLKFHRLAHGVRARDRAESASPDDLYIMQNSRIPGEFKIGRAQDARARQKDLQASQNFHMIVHAVFPEAGHLEKRVHDILAAHRVQDAPGAEWFKTSLHTAAAAVVMAKDSDANK